MDFCPIGENEGFATVKLDLEGVGGGGETEVEIIGWCGLVVRGRGCVGGLHTNGLHLLGKGSDGSEDSLDEGITSAFRVFQAIGEGAGSLCPRAGTLDGDEDFPDFLGTIEASRAFTFQQISLGSLRRLAGKASKRTIPSAGFLFGPKMARLARSSTTAGSLRYLSSRRER